MSQAAYSALKAAWHIDRVADLREGKQIVPVEIQFIISDFCNQDCYFCAYRASEGLSSAEFVEYEDGERIHNPMRQIPKEKCVEILNDAAELGVKSIIWTGGGEPTVHPDHMELFKLALELGLDCSLNTNGLVLRKGWEDVLPKFKYVRWSVDAGTDEEYGRVRQVPASQYKRVLANIEKVCKLTVPAGCVSGAGYVVTPDNYMNLMTGIKNLRDAGVQYVRLASMQSTQQYAIYKGVEEAVNEARAGAKLLETDDFKVVDLFDVALGTRMTDPFCGMQQYVVYIGGNQHVYRCCYTAFTELGDIGDLTNQGFADWFYSQSKEDLIEHFDARDCTICPLAHKNETIRYMRDPEPLHVNFV